MESMVTAFMEPMNCKETGNQQFLCSVGQARYLELGEASWRSDI